MTAPQTLPPFATIIHLGAGEGERFEEFKEQGAKRIILLEPAVSAAKSLERRTTGWAGTQVIHAAASSRNGQAELHIWNLARLNSLVPTCPQMHELYPGLQQRSQQSVRLLSPRSLLAEIGEIEGPVLLIVETPGTERDTLEGWKADGLLEKIDQIELHCTEEVLYEGASTRAELEAWLANEDFVVTVMRRDDPDWPVVHLCADHTARALKRAREKIAEHLETISQQAKALAARDTALKEATGRVEALEKSLTQTKAEAEEKAKTLAARDTALKKASERADELEKALAERDHRLRGARDELRRAEGQLMLITDLLLRESRV